MSIAAKPPIRDAELLCGGLLDWAALVLLDSDDVEWLRIHFPFDADALRRDSDAEVAVAGDDSPDRIDGAGLARTYEQDLWRHYETDVDGGPGTSCRNSTERLGEWK